MRMKYAVAVLVISFIAMLFDTVVALSMSLHEEAEKATKIEERQIEIEPVEFYKMQATAYCINGTTATGTQTRIGVAASKPEWFGRRVAVYKQDSNGYPAELIGEYTVEDTGSTPIRTGKVIDIWFPSYDAAIKFGRKNVIVYLLD